MTTRRDGPAGVAWAPVRRHLRAVRRHHGARSPRAVAGLVYEWLLYLFIAGGVLVTALSSTVASFATPAGGVAGWLGACAAAGAAAAVASGLLAVGPVVPGPAVVSWLLPSPIRRRELFGSRAVGVVVAVTAFAGGATGLVAASAGSTRPLLVACVGAATGALIAALCLLVQTGSARSGSVAGAAVRGVLAVTVLLAAALVAAARTGIVLPSVGLAGTGATWAVVVVVAVASVPATWTAVRRLDRTGTPALTGGSSLVAGLWSASVALDPALTAGVVEDRRLRRHGVVRSRRHPRGRRRALVTAAARAALRNRTASTWAIGLLVVPYVAALLVPPVVVPVVQLAGATAVASRFAASLRAIAGSAALRRSVGGRDRELVAWHCVVPFLAAATWSLLVAGAGGSTVSVVLLPACAVAVVLRTATRPPPPATMTLYESPVGVSVPVELAASLSRGPVLFAVLAGVQALVGG